jgi:6-phosphofructokinase 1
VPRSIENDIAATAVSFGFNSALSFTIEMLDRCRQAAQSARKIGVVEVLGGQAGWLALQAGIAVCADAVLIPEIPCDLRTVASRLKDKVTPRRPYGLVVVAEGATFVDDPQAQAEKPSVNPLKASLSPLATGDASDHVIQRSGQAAATVANGLQLLIAEEVFPLVLGPWVRGGVPTAVDRQLGIGYGAGAVRALKAGKNGTMVAFVPPDMKFVPLADAINKVRTVPVDSEFMQIARALGICLGREL